MKNRLPLRNLNRHLHRLPPRKRLLLQLRPNRLLLLLSLHQLRLPLPLRLRHRPPQHLLLLLNRLRHLPPQQNRHPLRPSRLRKKKSSKRSSKNTWNSPQPSRLPPTTLSTTGNKTILSIIKKEPRRALFFVPPFF
jgi:hypothetical protein